MALKAILVSLILTVSGMTLWATTPSVVTLTSSVNPAILGHPLTLTATVAPSAATGAVTFYNGPSVLGTAALAGGKASILTGTLPSGLLSLSVYYAGDALYSASSGTLKQTVNTLPTMGFQPPLLVKNIPVSLLAGFLQTADVNGDGKADFLLDNANGGTEVLLGNGDGTFQNLLNNDLGKPGGTRFVGDFNGDGKPDLITAGNLGMQLAFGNGNGTFQPFTYVSGPFEPAPLAIVDFNRDGKADIYGTTTWSVVPWRGNGDGTFDPLSGYSVAPSNANGLAPFISADFNGDGIADIAFAATNDGGDQPTILLGKGDGTFQSPLFFRVKIPPSKFAAGDFNGDGKVDLIAIDLNNHMAVMLGMGDGTFQLPIKYDVGASSQYLTVVDLNGDGKADVLTVSPQTEDQRVILGNGDGTFSSFIDYPVAIGAPNVAVGDFNGDGRNDLAFLVNYNLYISFGMPTTLSSSSTVVTSSVDVSAINTPITFTASVTPSNATGEISFVEDLTPLGTATVAAGKATFSIATLPPGTHSIGAVYSGDSTYASSSSTSINVEVLPSFSIAPGLNTLTVTVPSGATLGVPVVFTEGAPSSSAANPDFALAAGGTTCAGRSSGTCTVAIQFTPQSAGLRRGAFKLVDTGNNVLATYFFSGVSTGPPPAFSAAGAAVVTPIYSPAIGYPFGVTVDGAGNSFVVDAYKNQIFKVSPGGAITTVALGTTLNSPGGLALDAAGNLYIADAGNNRILKLPYGTATATSLNVTGLNHPEAVAVDGSDNVFIANTHFVSPNSTPGNVIELSASGVQSTVTTGSLNYPSGLALDAAGDIFVAEKYNSLVIGFTVTNGAYICGSGLSVAAGVAVDGAGNVFVADQNNGRVVEIAAGPSGPCSGAQTTLASGRLLMPNALALDSRGDVFVASIGSGNVSGNVLELQNVNAMQTISFGAIAPQNLGTSPPLTASASSGLPVSYTSKTPGVCTVSGSAVTLVASGTCTILASQAGGGAYLPAATVAQSFTVFGPGQTLTTTFTISGSVTLGTPVVFTEGVPSTTLTAPDFALVSSGTTCTGVVSGSCTVNVEFTPQFAGLRRGAVKLVDSHNNLIATSYISGVGANSQTAFVPGMAQTLTSFGAVSGVAVDGGGHVFFIAGSGLVYEIVAGKAIPVPLGTTLNSASGLALDGAGNLYVADSGNNRILELPYGTSSAVALNTTGLVYPQGVATDGAGNIFVANTRASAEQGYGSVIELAAGTQAQTALISNGLDFPVGLAVDAAGDLFVADWGSNRVVKLSASGALSSIGSGLSNASGLAVDGIGDVFILDQNHNQLVEVPATASGPGTGTQTTVATGLLQPRGIALDGRGNVFVSNLGTATSPGSLVEVPKQ